MKLASIVTRLFHTSQQLRLREMDCVTFTPKPGFVVKSSTLNDGFYYHDPSGFVPQVEAGSFATSTTNRTNSASTIPVPSNRKIFINLAYASEIPPPPIEDEAVIHRALLGQVQQDESQPEYFIPVLVGFGREDKDKAGNLTTVFDAFFNPVVKKRLTEDINYRTYVLEIVLSTLESDPYSTTRGDMSRSLSLSRTLATPNVRFKGPLTLRRVPKVELSMLGGPKVQSSPPAPTIPSTLVSKSGQPKSPLIEELSSNPSTSKSNQLPKSILKKNSSLPSTQSNPNTGDDPHVKTLLDNNLTIPAWRWSLEKPGSDLVVTISIDIPDMVRPAHSQSTLSLSTDILTFRSPKYFLQIPLDNQSVKLPPNRTVDIDKAKAEWRISDKRLIVYLRCVSTS